LSPGWKLDVYPVTVAKWSLATELEGHAGQPNPSGPSALFDGRAGTNGAGLANLRPQPLHQRIEKHPGFVD